MANSCGTVDKNAACSNLEIEINELVELIYFRKKIDSVIRLLSTEFDKVWEEKGTRELFSF